MIRTNRIPFLQSRASWPMIFTSVAVVLVAAWLPVSPLAGALGLVRLPALFWPLLAAMLVAYVGLTQIVKTWFNRRFHPEEPAISGAGSSLVLVPSAAS